MLTTPLWVVVPPFLTCTWERYRRPQDLLPAKFHFALVKAAAAGEEEKAAVSRRHKQPCPCQSPYSLSAEDARSVLCLLDSLTLNYYIRNKMSATLNMFYMYELPVPKLTAVQKKKLAEFAAKLLKNPRDVKERAALEVFIARELYGLSPDDWKHLTGTFTFGSGDSKAELDEIIRQSVSLWPNPDISRFFMGAGRRGIF